MTTRYTVAIATCAAISMVGYCTLLFYLRKYGRTVVGSGDFSGRTVMHVSIVGFAAPAVAGIVAAAVVLLLWRN
jgi:hypothetical protein